MSPAQAHASMRAQVHASMRAQAVRQPLRCYLSTITETSMHDNCSPSSLLGEIHSLLQQLHNHIDNSLQQSKLMKIRDALKDMTAHLEYDDGTDTSSNVCSHLVLHLPLVSHYFISPSAHLCAQSKSFIASYLSALLIHLKHLISLLIYMQFNLSIFHATKSQLSQFLPPFSLLYLGATSTSMFKLMSAVVSFSALLRDREKRGRSGRE